MKRIENCIIDIFIFAFLIVIAYITCLSRTPSEAMQVAPYPFWSFVEAARGDQELFIEIIENILFFMPLGFLLAERKIGFGKCVLWGMAVSTAVELSQMFFHLGLFEFDDIFNNTLGAFVGALIFVGLKISDEVKLAIATVVVTCSVGFCICLSRDQQLIAIVNSAFN